MHTTKKVPANWRIWLSASMTVLLLLSSSLSVSASPASSQGGGFNHSGNILIADQFNNRVIEVDQNHNVVWQFGNGSNVAGPHSVVGVNDAERVGDLTLVARTGTPAGADPSCPDPNGCPDNRVMLVNQSGKIVWQYGKAGVTGSGHNQLSAPVQATALPNGDFLITDQGNQRVIEVTKHHELVWQYGMTGVSGAGFNQLNNPNSAEALANGNILIADESNNRVIEVTRDHGIVWQYGTGDPSIINGSAFASRLPNGDTLISDSGNNRVVEVSKAGSVVWSYVTNMRPGSVDNPTPTRAVRLRNGNTLISDQFNHQVIEVTPAGNIVWSQGMIAMSGNGFNQLDAPYDAKVIGDYTGLTPP